MSSSKIIVATTLHKEYLAEGCLARLEGLGITGYGQTMAEAENNAKTLFNDFIREYRRLGVLEDRLTNHFKVSWWPIEQYDGELEVEDTASEEPVIEPDVPPSSPQDSTVAWRERAA